jgi:glycosyltransferase involved in cell wall biosynthesis
MLSTVIITYNRKKLNEACIESYLDTMPVSGNELIVVDNNSTDGTKEYLQKKKASNQIDQLLINPKNYHLGKAVNLGFSLCSSKSKYLGKFDNDGFFEDGWFQNVTSVAEVTNADIIICAINDIDYEKFSKSEKGVKFVERPKDVGGSFYVKKSFLEKSKLRFQERPWAKNYVGPNPYFFRSARKHGARIVRIFPPFVSRKFETYSDPEFHEYYRQSFEVRGLANLLKKRQHVEKGNNKGWWNG